MADNSSSDSNSNADNLSHTLGEASISSGKHIQQDLNLLSCPDNRTGQNEQQQEQQFQPVDISQLQCDNILRQILNEKKLNLMKSPEVKNFFKQIAAKSHSSSSIDTYAASNNDNKLDEV